MKITIADVARAAGVSAQTVSRVLNNKAEITPETRQLVTDVIAQMGYRPSSIARSLATNRTYTIGLSVPDIANPFWPEIARGVEDVAWEQGYNVFLCNTTETPPREEAVLRLLEDKRVDGVIVAGSRLPDERLLPLIAGHAAVVLINRTVPDDRAGAVLVDAPHGAAAAVNHLVAGGRQRIAFLAGPTTSQNSQRHIGGYSAALQAAGRCVDPALIVPCAPTISGGYGAITALLRARPDIDGLFCYNDLIALGVLHACAALGLCVPDDLAVVGYDDILLAGMATPPLTTLRAPKYDVGAAAARMLFEHINKRCEQREVVITPELIVRGSAPCGGPKEL